MESIGPGILDETFVESEVIVKRNNALSHFAVFLCGLAPWRELCHRKTISRKDAKGQTLAKAVELIAAGVLLRTLK